MNTTLKSVRIENEILELAENYINYSKKVLGFSSNLPSLINGALPEYIALQISILRLAMREGNDFVLTDEKGRVYSHSVTRSDIDGLEELLECAKNLAGYYEEGGPHLSLSMSDDEILALAENIKRRKGLKDNKEEA